jgi:hypothetical protein
MCEVSDMIYLTTAIKPGFFYKLSVNSAHPNAAFLNPFTLEEPLK